MKSLRRTRSERKRHERLMDSARRLADREGTSPILAQKYVATAADMIALAFGRHQLTIDDPEATRYLDAARAEAGVRT